MNSGHAVRRCRIVYVVICVPVRSNNKIHCTSYTCTDSGVPMGGGERFRSQPPHRNLWEVAIFFMFYLNFWSGHPVFKFITSPPEKNSALDRYWLIGNLYFFSRFLRKEKKPSARTASSTAARRKREARRQKEFGVVGT